MTKIMMTGARGFAGAHLVREIVKNTDWEILSVERLPQTDLPDRLSDIPKNRLFRFYHDFRSEFPLWLLEALQGVEYIIHSGAEVHGIRSLASPELFINTNVMGTFHVLNAARFLKPKRFFFASTSEVFPPAPYGHWHAETSTMDPQNPYAASKAAGEMLVSSWSKCYNVPSVVTRACNLFGEMQGPDKFIPKTIQRILSGTAVEIHTDKQGESSRRQWLHAQEWANAVLFLLQHPTAEGVYHVAGLEISTRDVASCLAHALMRDLLITENSDHGAHSMRNGIAGVKLGILGWRHSDLIQESLKQTALWTSVHPEWL